MKKQKKFTPSYKDFETIFSYYPIKGELKECKPFGEGHINNTYLAVFTYKNHKQQYIIQRINNQIFKHVDKLMNNIALVTKHCQKKIKQEGKDPTQLTLTIIQSKKHQNYVIYKNNYYRVYIYIKDSITFQTVKEPKDFYNSALAFGNFYRLLNGFNAKQLYEIIPNFHNTKMRYENFNKALKADKLNRAKTCQKEIKFIQARKHYYPLIINMLKKKELPLKVTHNDTKLNNILFHVKTSKPLAVIDLDTIMPGTICYDFGDAIRFGTNSAKEDEPNLNKVHFRFDLYKIYLKGFLKALGKNITKKEKETLALASIMMTIECGMRFLTDYLEGDHYFHIKYPDHNLIRTRTQLKLVSDMEKMLPKMKALVK